MKVREVTEAGASIGVYPVEVVGSLSSESWSSEPSSLGGGFGDRGGLRWKEISDRGGLRWKEISDRGWLLWNKGAPHNALGLTSVGMICTEVRMVDGLRQGDGCADMLGRQTDRCDLYEK